MLELFPGEVGGGGVTDAGEGTRLGSVVLRTLMSQGSSVQISAGKEQQEGPVLRSSES